MKKKFEPIKFDQDFLKMALDFLNTFYILDIDVNSMFQLSNKEKEVLSKLKKIYSKIKLVKDYETVDLAHITTEETLKLANNFFNELLPSKSKEILTLDNLVVFKDITIYEAGLTYKLSKNKVEFGEILIPDNCSLYDASTIVHEKTHALTFSNLDLVDLFQNGLELFPMLFQKIMLYNSNDEIASIYDTIIRIVDVKECFFNLETIKYLEEYTKDKEASELAYNYFYIRSYDYLLSDLYSSILVEYYKLNKETMIKRLNALFNGKITIKAFLDSYDISLFNKDLIPIIKEDANKCKRIVILP